MKTASDLRSVHSFQVLQRILIVDRLALRCCFVALHKRGRIADGQDQVTSTERIREPEKFYTGCNGYIIKIY